MSTNPYDSPRAETHRLAESQDDPLIPVAKVWLAYAIAPAIAPISFIVFFVGVCAIAIAAGFQINSASLLIFPIVGFGCGVIVSYVVAGLIGMPIAFYLRRRNRLNFYSIQLAALLCSMFVIAAMLMTFFGGSWREFSMITSALVVGITPPVFLAGTLFWMLVRRRT